MVFMRALPQTPRRTVKYASGVFSRAPCIHGPLWRPCRFDYTETREKCVLPGIVIEMPSVFTNRKHFVSNIILLWGRIAGKNHCLYSMSARAMKKPMFENRFAPVESEEIIQDFS